MIVLRCKELSNATDILPACGRFLTPDNISDATRRIYNARALSILINPSRLQASSPRTSSVPLQFGAALPTPEFRDIQRKLALDHCKWDCQVGDVSTLFRQPLLMTADEWVRLKRFAEDLANELALAEEELFRRPQLHKMLGMPKPLCSVLKDAALLGATPSAVRAMRFDFHYTTEGWRISEVNSDVPGGYIESSVFAEMVAECVPQAALPEYPARVWLEAITSTVSEQRSVALLSAVGFLEDQQVTAFLAVQLEQRGIETVLLHHPAQLRWEAGYASTMIAGKRVQLGAVVRFYQGEWLAGTRDNRGWQWLFARGKTPVTNPATAVLTESKRFPLTWEFLSNGMSQWQKLLPQCCDPKDECWRNGDEWVLKMAYSNTGDEVHMRDLMSREAWSKVCRAVRRNPEHWVVQRRFQPRAIESDVGPVHPCIGIYVINGSVAGAYARVSRGQIVDYAAMDAALLILETQC